MKQLSQYITYLKNRNLSPHTILNYPITIQQFKDKYSTTNLLNYTKQLLKKYEVGSCQVKLAALKSFAKFSKIKTDWKRIIEFLPQVQKKFFATLDEEELKKIKGVRFEKQETIWKRNNLMLDFLFYTGIRVSELVNLKHSDWENNHLKILGKGNKVRYVFLPPALINQINPYSRNYLFTNCQGERISREYIVQLIRKRTLLATIKKKITPHTFRRSFATLLNGKGTRLTTIQKLLGHTQLNTTASYIHNSWEELYRDYSRLWKEPTTQINHGF